MKLLELYFHITNEQSNPFTLVSHDARYWYTVLIVAHVAAIQAYQATETMQTRRLKSG